MKVLVIGANGQIGKMVTKQLHGSNEHTVRAMVRSEEQADALSKQGIEAVVANLEDRVEEIGQAMDGCDAVVFTAGSGGKTGADKTLLIDLDGAVKSIEAAEQRNIERFIMVSAFQANNRENWNENLRPYYVAKHYADRILEDSSLHYTIIRPGGLLNEPGTGKVQVGAKLERFTIPREDVASTIVAALTEPTTYKRSFDLVSGEKSIEELIKLV